MRYFGTDGIRGVYGQTIDEELAYKAGLAAAQLFGDCFVGRDTRVSGDSLCDALALGLNHGGCNIRDVGILPTPAISFLAARYGIGGIMVSASHNPPDYNGLKFFSPQGYKLTVQLENSLEEYILRPPARIGGGMRIDYACGKDEYLDRITNGVRLDGKEVSLDCAHGAACAVAREAFERCGAKVISYADDGDGSKINCGVGALYPNFIESKASGLGFAFDGDGDRLAVSCNGALDGDSVLYDLALSVKPRGVVGTIMNNMALENRLRQIGMDFIRTSVGDKHIGEAMRLHGYTLGGEQSGHYIISPATSGDALYAALTLSDSKELVRLELVPQTIASIEALPSVMYCNTFDMCKKECERELEGKGRLVVRMSGTEPKIRLMAECEDEELLKRIMEKLIETIGLCNKEIL